MQSRLDSEVGNWPWMEAQSASSLPQSFCGGIGHAWVTGEVCSSRYHTEVVVSRVVYSGRQVTPGCGLLPTAGLLWSPWRRLLTVGLQAGWGFQCHLERLCRVPS